LSKKKRRKRNPMPHFQSVYWFDSMRTPFVFGERKLQQGWRSNEMTLSEARRVSTLPANVTGPGIRLSQPVEHRCTVTQLQLWPNGEEEEN
jgi:hypothetical protein